MRVEIISGQNVTELTYFTTGSHRDDVLRLQGKPDSVIYRENVDEWWSWGNSYVIFDLATDRVVSWGNTSGNLNVRMK